MTSVSFNVRLNPAETPRPDEAPVSRWPLYTAAVALLAALAFLTLIQGCATREHVVMREAVVVEHPTVRSIPAPIHEDRGAPPAPGWGWVPGHWKWEGSDWAWVHGRWVQQVVPVMPPIVIEQITVAPSPHHYWVPGHWVWRFDGGGGWWWAKGGWRG